MRRILFLFAILASGLLSLSVVPAGPAIAGDIYGYSPPVYGPALPVAASGCCARAPAPVPVRYLRYVEQLPYCAYCDTPPPRYVANPYWPPDCSYDGCYGYMGGAFAAAPGVCTSRRVRVVDRRGRRVWQVRTVCY